jgi:hypothetical protein
MVEISSPGACRFALDRRAAGDRQIWRPAPGRRSLRSNAAFDQPRGSRGLYDDFFTGARQAYLGQRVTRTRNWAGTMPRASR